jgi:glycosyltransferase involved in cell wall biosynthesis
VPLLDRLAEAYPAATIALVGPDALTHDEAYRRLRARPNVRWLGRQPLAALPRFLKTFDAALLPYSLGGHTHAIYPLKLHEYLAAGRAVVATDMPELGPFAGHVRIARDAAHFVTLAAEAAADNTPARQAERSDLARHHTWEQRVALVHQALDLALAGRSQRAAPTPQRQPLPPPLGGPQVRA